MTIRMVTGDIAPQELGFCQAHEHIFLEKGKPFAVNPTLCMDDYDASAAELERLRRAGGNALVDAQPAMCGRMAEELVRASLETGVRVIAVTGFHKTIYYEDGSYIFTASADDIAQFYLEEIMQGMLASRRAGGKRLSCRAGIVKAAVDREGIHANKTYEKLFEAAAICAQKTGAPVMVHIEQQADALKVIDYFLSAGIAPGKLVICHLDRARYDIAYHEECLQTGCFLEYDTINRPKYHDNEKEARLIEAILGRGWAAQILMGLDTTRARLKNYGADMGLDYLLQTFLPWMKTRGMTQEQCEAIFIGNPSRAFAFSA